MASMNPAPMVADLIGAEVARAAARCDPFAPAALSAELGD